MKKQPLRRKLERMNLDAKLCLYTTVLIVMITVVMLSVSTVFTVCSLYQKSEEAAKSKLSFVADSYGNWLETNKNTLLSLQLAPELQAFCSCLEKSDKRYATSRKQVLDTIENLLASNLDINFISVTSQATDSYVYRGNRSITTTGYDSAYKTGLEKSQPAKEKGSVRIDFGNNFFGGSKYSVTFYQPIYSVTILDKQIGMLCMNVNDTLLKKMEQLGNIESAQTFLADKRGIPISEERGTDLRNDWILDYGGMEKGSKREDGHYYYFQKISDWNYYVVNSVAVTKLYKSSIQVACIMLVIMVVLLIGSIIVIRKSVRKCYEQVSSIVEGMDHIAQNEMDYRISTSSMGEDFKKLGNGFNHMIDEINKLMLTVREEQYQIDQIRFQALQYQIQPHFLYNTLECIHWQSSAEGNKQVSKLVMALASYYRISLSKGKDIISLQEELLHVQNYLYIQNQRFGDLVTCEIEVPEEYMELKIPKLTLQPLVENALYHGICMKEGNKGFINISVTAQGESVWIKIADSGSAMTKEKIQLMNQWLTKDEEQFGYGVRNVNKRIVLLFGSEYGLKYLLNESNGTTVCIHLPLGENRRFGGRQNV